MPLSVIPLIKALESSGDEVTGESEEIGYGGEFPGFFFFFSNN